MKKLKAIIHIIFSSEYFVAVSNNLNNDKKPTTLTYYINTNRKILAVTIRDYLENICFEE